MMSRPDKNYRYFVHLVLQFVVLRRILKNTPCGFSFNVYSYFISLGKNLTIWGMSFRSQSQMQAAFLQHEGYLGAIGALMSYGDPIDENLTLKESNEKVSPYAEYIQKYMFFFG
jgi:hypothetical protein